VQLGRVIGRVRATIKDPNYVGLTLVMLEPLAEDLSAAGEPLVAADPLGAALGQVVFWESSLEARMAAPNPKTALDAAVVGFVDRLGSQCNSGG
jgi:ethanolamine utilization protein EutN